MSIHLIQQRLSTYQCQTVLEQDNALKEIAQEITLMTLSRTGFFRAAAFQGGTCLRILYGLERFSEDLDFVLLKSDPDFQWSQYIANMREEFAVYGYTLAVEDRSKVEKAVKMAFLKADSVGGLLILKEADTNRPKLKIKLEVDTNPPAGSEYELKYLDFPLPFSVNVQDLPSLFAGKCHALLCREYVKGRDWYDFIWYIARRTPINFELLTSALNQVGPWQAEGVTATPQWLLQQLLTKIATMDWQAAKQDVVRFLRPREAATLELWSHEFFLSRVEKLADYLSAL